MLHVYDNSSVALRVWIPVTLVILFNIILILTKRVPGAIIVGLTDIVIGVFYYKKNVLSIIVFPLRRRQKHRLWPRRSAG